MIKFKNYSFKEIKGVKDEQFVFCNFTGASFKNCSGLSFIGCNLRNVEGLPDDSKLDSESQNANTKFEMVDTKEKDAEGKILQEPKVTERSKFKVKILDKDAEKIKDEVGRGKIYKGVK